MRRGLLFVIAGLLITSAFVLAQEPEWPLRISSYFRLKGGSSRFCVDPTRNAILFDGGAYDTYVTSDEGRSWRTIFDIKMFYIDNSTSWMIDQTGRWYYEGRVYGKFTVNLVSEHGGDSLRYLLIDTGYMGKNRVWGEAMPRLVPPNAVVFDATGRPDTGQGIYFTTDAGRSFRKFQGMTTNRSVMFLRPVRPGAFAVIDSAWNAIEVDVNTGAMTTTNVTARHQYVRLADNTVVQGGSGFLQIRRPTDTAFTVHRTYVDPVSGLERPMGASYIGLVNDTLALILGTAGETFIVGQRQGLRVLNAPIFRTRYQTVIAVGFYKDLVITTACIPEGTAAAGNEYTVYNVRTGVHSVHRHPGYSSPMPFLGDLSSYQIIPVTEQEWLASFRVGEFLRTTNAGATWSYVESIEQDPQWGQAWVGLARLFPRGDGSMATMTDQGRLMIDRATTGKWEVVLPGLFTHKQRLPPNYTEAFTRTNLTFGDDFAGRYRHRYGPSTVFFPKPDECWVSGDALTRYTADGQFIDTLLHRKARYIKRISPSLIAASMDSLYFTFNEGKEWVYVGYMLPKYTDGTARPTAGVGDLVQADDGSIILGLRGMKVADQDGSLRDSIPGGLMISTNGGNTWIRTGAEIDRGLYVSSLHKTANGTLLCMASEVNIDLWYVNPIDGEYRRYENGAGPEAIFKLERTFIYRSTDHGRTWTSAFIFPDRERLGQTDIRFAAMPDGRVLAIHPSFGIAISANDGRTWSIGDPLNIGNPIINDVVFTDDGYVHFATDEGYARLRIENIVSVQDDRRVAVGDLDAHVTSDGMLRMSSDDEITSVTISAIDGRVMTTRACHANGVDVDMAAWPRGAYLVMATTSAGPRRSLVVR
jgi:hypothetical protein